MKVYLVLSRGPASRRLAAEEYNFGFNRLQVHDRFLAVARCEVPNVQTQPAPLLTPLVPVVAMLAGGLEAIANPTRHSLRCYAATRHTFCTMLGRAGMTPHERRMLMRHTDLQTTLRYTHLQLVDLSAALDGVKDLGLGTRGGCAEFWMLFGARMCTGLQ